MNAPRGPALCHSTAMYAQVESLTSWVLLAQRGPFLRFLPALASTLLLWAVLQHARSPLALPATLLAIPAAFYAVLLAAGLSLADAQGAGWVPQPAEVLIPKGTRGQGVMSSALLW